MFSVGDEVVCIDDTPVRVTLQGWLVYREPVPFRKGERFRVQKVFCPGDVVEDAAYRWTFECVCIGIGRTDPRGSDVWSAERFRKVQRKSTQEAMRALKGLFVPGSKTRELV